MTRTPDLRITNALLYQLSYVGTWRAASIFKTLCLHNTALISDNTLGTEPILSGGAMTENLALDKSKWQWEEENEWALSIFSNRILID